MIDRTHFRRLRSTLSPQVYTWVEKRYTHQKATDIFVCRHCHSECLAAHPQLLVGRGDGQ